ncbi:hypothetical protein FGW20_07590 [Methanoculleus sp. FWC-SCC3]|uniref:Uncharacterized protein n=1 Tax=Methanoculleus methanifontis TaxID=2584086 RepID=A0ABT8M3Y6_9EURY|nr:hypothetical protein [Methanoculleus sp. FWC-SCC3]
MGNNLLYGDQIHIEQIRKYLWSGREYGRAAVIVGSGFSRNAERFSLTTCPFPMWNDLGKMFYDALNLDRVQPYRFTLNIKQVCGRIIRYIHMKRGLSTAAEFLLESNVIPLNPICKMRDLNVRTLKSAQVLPREIMSPCTVCVTRDPYECGGFSRMTADLLHFCHC